MKMQDRKLNNVMIINPTKMNEDEEIILHHVLENQASKGIYYHSKNCLLPIPHQVFEHYVDINIRHFNEIRLTHSILRRLRGRDQNQHRYELYGDVIGGGGFGKVAMSIGTLVPLENQRMIFKKNNVRVIKEMISTNERLHMQIAQLEYEMTRRDEELGVKRPVFFKDSCSSEIHSFMVMKFIPGQELQKNY